MSVASSTLSATAHSAVSFARQVPTRLRERSFWLIQAMVLGVTGLHFLAEISAYAGPMGGAHHIPVTLYLVPIIYAGLRYRTEGSLLTGLWCAILTVPNIAIWHLEGFFWLGEVGQVATLLGIGAIIAWRVEREAAQRRQAEQTSARLALLNDVAITTSRYVRLHENLGVTLQKVADALRARGAWAAVKEEASGDLLLTAQVGQVGGGWRRCSALAVGRRRTGMLAAGLMAVPLLAEDRVLGALGVSVMEGRTLSRDETDFLRAVGSQLAVALDNARLYREEQETVAEQRRIQEALRDYANRVTQAQEEERRRIARELHDDTAHALLVLCRTLDSLRDGGTGSPSAPPLQLDEAYEMARTTLQNIRRFSRDLRPSILDDLGLIPAIEWLTSEMSTRAGIAASVKVSGAARRMPSETELVLFRIGQEALRNAEKHSQASAVRVSVRFRGEGVTLSVVDNGKGFASAGAGDQARLGKLGITGMRERAQLVNASFSLYSRPGLGTRVQVKVIAEPAGA